MSGQLVKADDHSSGPPARVSDQQPLYRQVAGVLRGEIVSGLFPVGAQFPTEEALCGRFCVSRFTIREALRLLREDALVASRRGAGTVVIAPTTSSSDIHQVMSISDLVAYAAGLQARHHSISMVTLDGKLAQKTGLEKATDWLQVLGRRSAAGEEQATCLTEYYIHRMFAAVGRIIPRHEGPVFQLIEDMYGQQIEKVHQQVSARLLSPEEAGAFALDQPAAGLQIRRAYETLDGTIAQVTINTHPADRFQHSMTMRRVKP